MPILTFPIISMFGRGLLKEHVWLYYKLTYEPSAQVS